MNKEDTRAAAQVMMAAADGKTIEVKQKYSDQEWSHCIIGSPTWDWVNMVYRVKKRSGTHWLVIGPYGECHQAYQTEDDARAHVLGDTSLIVIQADWEEE